MSTNFFKDWIVEYLPQNLGSRTAEKASRTGNRDTKRLRGTGDIDGITHSKVQLVRKQDNFTLSEGDTVYFSGPGIAKEIWHVYNIDVKEIMGEISVHGILLQDNKTLKEDYNATIPLTDSSKREISDLYEVVMIPEIKTFFSNATYTHINLHSCYHFEKDKKIFEVNAEDHKFVNKIFVSETGKFVSMDFEVLVSKDMPGCTTTLDKILYIIDHSNVNSTNLNETIPLTKTEQVQPKLTNKTIEDNSSKYDASITGNADQKAKDLYLVDSGQETESNDEATGTDEDEVIILNTEVSSIKSETEMDELSLAAGLKKKPVATRAPKMEERMQSTMTTSTASKVTKKPRTQKSTSDSKRTKAVEKYPQVHKAFTAADFTNSYQRMKQTQNRKAGSNGTNYKTTSSDTVESFRQRMSTNEDTALPDEHLDEQAGNDRYAVPGRENEFRNLYSRIASFVNTGTGSSIYLSGVPGTGKTFTVKKTIESLFGKNRNMFMFAEINGFKLINLDDCYESLCDKLDIAIPTGSTALTTLQNFFTHRESKKVVLLLDEIDVLLKHDAEKLYNFFNWPYLANSKLFVIAVGNNLNLSEQLDAKTNSRLGAMNIITFPPYSQQNLADILRHTLGEFTKNNKVYIEKSSGSIALFSSSASAKFAEKHKFFFQLLDINFSEEAITFLSRSAATSTSDVRTAKGIGFAAIEMVEEEYGRLNGVIYNYEKTIDMDSFPDDSEFENAEFDIIKREVTTAVAAAAKNKASSASAVEYVKNLTFLNQFILYVALNIFNTFNNTTIPFTTLIHRVEVLLDKYSVTRAMKASFKMMNMMNDVNGAENIRLFDWDASLNTLEGIGMITFSKSLNERGNFLVLKNVESIEEGLKGFEKSLL